MSDQRHGQQGSIAFVKGTRRSIICPQCGNAPVVYNGNYFCDNWAHSAGPGRCTWALEHPAATTEDRKICDLIGINYD